MSEQKNIGYKARLLDEMSLKERLKIEGRSVKKIVVALIIYACIMTFFMTFL